MSRYDAMAAIPKWVEREGWRITQAARALHKKLARAGRINYCEPCDRVFVNAEALEQHNRAKHAPTEGVQS